MLCKNNKTLLQKNNHSQPRKGKSGAEGKLGCETKEIRKVKRRRRGGVNFDHTNKFSFSTTLVGSFFFFVWSFRVLCVSCLCLLCVLSCLVVCLVLSCLVLLSCLVFACLPPSAKHNPYLTRCLSIFDFPLTGLRLCLCLSPSPFVFLDCFFELRLIRFIYLKPVRVR